MIFAQTQQPMNPIGAVLPLIDIICFLFYSYSSATKETEIA